MPTWTEDYFVVGAEAEWYIGGGAGLGVESPYGARLDRGEAFVGAALAFSGSFACEICNLVIPGADCLATAVGESIRCWD